MSRSDSFLSADEEAEFSRALLAARQNFVEALANELDLDTGIALVSVGGHQAALAEELAAEMSLEVGLTSILGRETNSKVWPRPVSIDGLDSVSRGPEAGNSAMANELAEVRYSLKYMEAVSSVALGLTFGSRYGYADPELRPLYMSLLRKLQDGSLTLPRLHSHVRRLADLAARPPSTIPSSAVGAMRDAVAAFLQTEPAYMPPVSGAAAQVVGQIEDLHDAVLDAVLVNLESDDVGSAHRFDSHRLGAVTWGLIDLRKIIETHSGGLEDAMVCAGMIRQVLEDDRSSYGIRSYHMAQELVPAVKALFSDSCKDSVIPTSS